MHKFDADSPQCVVVMYPTGGYGNFLYYLLAEHLECTVKIAPTQWQFRNGHSHDYPKHTESFLLGSATNQKTLGSFRYDYGIIQHCAVDQIREGKKFIVLADVGNKGDNIRFLSRYFPRATIVRVFVSSFYEKLIVWTNCMLKSGNTLRDELYPGSILTTEGIAVWANKSPQDVTDGDAVDCMAHFFRSDFDVYGQMFAAPLPEVINVSAKSFFTQDNIQDLMLMLATKLETKCVATDLMTDMITEFMLQQQALTLLRDGDSFPLIRKAVARYENADSLAT